METTIVNANIHKVKTSIRINQLWEGFVFMHMHILVAQYCRAQ